MIKKAYLQGEVEFEDGENGEDLAASPRNVGHNIYILAHQVQLHLCKENFVAHSISSRALYPNIGMAMCNLSFGLKCADSGNLISVGTAQMCSFCTLIMFSYTNDQESNEVSIDSFHWQKCCIKFHRLVPPIGAVCTKFLVYH